MAELSVTLLFRKLLLFVEDELATLLVLAKLDEVALLKLTLLLFAWDRLACCC